MPPFTEGITRVRVRPMAIDLRDGQALVPAGAVEVQWDSTQADRWHQVYVNQQLAGVTSQPQDRRLHVTVPVGSGGPSPVRLVEVVAVDAADRWRDFGDQLSGFGEDAGAQVLLSWQGGEYLDPNLESFGVFGDDRTGTVDYTAPLNESPLAAKPGGLLPWGYGCGGYGVGGYGQAAACYEWVTDGLAPGTWRLAVSAVDAPGNRLATAAEVEIDVLPLPRPPEDFRLAFYDAGTRTATLGWQASPDL